jgi:hypothetical protein
MKDEYVECKSVKVARPSFLQVQFTAPFFWDMTPRRLVIDSRRFEVLSKRQERSTQ